MQVLTSVVSSGKWTFWKILGLFCWIASTSTKWGGRFLGFLLSIQNKLHTQKYIYVEFQITKLQYRGYVF